MSGPAGSALDAVPLLSAREVQAVLWRGLPVWCLTKRGDVARVDDAQEVWTEQPAAGPPGLVGPDRAPGTALRVRCCKGTWGRRYWTRAQRVWAAPR